MRSSSTNWATFAVIALASVSTVRSLCDDVQNYLNIPVPLEKDTEIELDVTSIVCPANGELPDALDEVIVEGGTLTLTSTNSFVSFVNLRFTVEDGASLVFDLDLTQFGPNSGYSENAQGFMIDVKEGGTVTFTGDFEGSEVKNVRSMFYNAGTMDFKGTATFEENGNVFRSNSGTLKFRDTTVFRDNWYLAIENIDSGFVRFSDKVTFERNAKFFDGGNGCAISNKNSDGRVIFRDDASFYEHSCDGAGAVMSAGTMKFYGKAFFFYNSSNDGNGGAVRNVLGSMLFKKAVRFGNNAAEFGGGLAVEGGDVKFNKAVVFDSNEAYQSGGAFSVTSGSLFEDGTTLTGDGLLTFKKSNVVRIRNNFVDSEDNDQSVTACEVGYVEDGSIVDGYPEEDICVEV